MSQSMTLSQPAAPGTLESGPQRGVSPATVSSGPQNVPTSAPMAPRPAPHLVMEIERMCHINAQLRQQVDGANARAVLQLAEGQRLSALLVERDKVVAAAEEVEADLRRQLRGAMQAGHNLQTDLEAQEEEIAALQEERRKMAEKIRSLEERLSERTLTQPKAKAVHGQPRRAASSDSSVRNAAQVIASAPSDETVALQAIVQAQAARIKALTEANAELRRQVADARGSSIAGNGISR